MKHVKKMLTFITTHEAKFKKIIDWSLTIGNLAWFIFKVVTNNFS
ncbi:hypothetical protein [Priestia megaterium]